MNKIITSDDVIRFMQCPKEYMNEIKNVWERQAKVYLFLIPDAEKVVIVGKNGEIIDEVVRE